MLYQKTSENGGKKFRARGIEQVVAKKTELLVLFPNDSPFFKPRF